MTVREKDLCKVAQSADGKSRGAGELRHKSVLAMQRTPADQLKEYNHRAMDRRGRCQPHAWCRPARSANHSAWVKLMRRTGLWFVAAVLICAPAAAQQQQPFSEDTVTQLVSAVLHQYFDSASVFEISVSGSTQVGDLLMVQDLLVMGNPVVWHGLRGEFLLHLSGVEVDLAALTNRTVKATRVVKATLVAKSTSAAIQDAVSRWSASLINPRIQLQNGSFVVTAIIRRDDALFPTVAHGALAVVQRQQVHLVLTDVTVSGSNVPVDLVGNELARINPLVDLSKYPIALFVDRLVLHSDGVEFLATNTK